MGLRKRSRKQTTPESVGEKKNGEKAREDREVEEETVTNEGIACSRMHRWC